MKYRSSSANVWEEVDDAVSVSVSASASASVPGRDLADARKVMQVVAEKFISEENFLGRILDKNPILFAKMRRDEVLEQLEGSWTKDSATCDAHLSAPAHR